MITNFYDKDNESVVLGSLIMFPECIGKIVNRIVPNYFYVENNRIIYDTVFSLYLQQVEITNVSVARELIATGHQDLCAYMSSLTNTTSTGANIEFYVDKLEKYWERRSLTDLLKASAEQLEDPNVDVSPLATKISDELFYLLAKETKSDIYSISDICEEFAAHAFDKVDSISSHFSRIDYKTYGFQKSEMTVIGARPSIGKTAFALNLFLNQAQRGTKVGFCSLEMGRMPIHDRLLCMLNDTNLNLAKALREKKFIDAKGNETPEFIKIKELDEVLKKMPIQILDKPNAKLSEIILSAKNFVLNKGVEILYIDYLGLIESELPNKTPEYEKISFVSKKLKQLARDLNIPVVALSQLNRDAEDNTPTLAQIRGSGSIEQDADVIMFLHGTRDIKDEAGESLDSIERRVIIAKNRNGSVGDCVFNFIRSKMKFEEKQ